jgi:hypothetical protein
MPRKFLLIGLMCWVFASRAQTEDKAPPVKKSCSCSFSSIEQIGILRGPYSSYFQAQTINGIRYKTWFAGVGAGLDYYRYKGVPIFLDVRKHFFKSKFSPFIYADGGIHLARMNNEKSGFSTIKYKNGFYYDVGLGYKLNLANKSGLLLSAGYSYKRVVYRQVFNYCRVCYPPTINSYEYSLNMSRLSLEMGWQF